MMRYFNEAIKPQNDELRTLLGLKERSRRIPVNYYGDNGSFESIPLDHKKGTMLVYVEHLTFLEALRKCPF